MDAVVVRDEDQRDHGPMIAGVRTNGKFWRGKKGLRVPP
jgi:hypothetical protein